MSPEQNIAIILTAQEWNQVLGVLSEGRYNVVAPLINKIHEQAMRDPTQAGSGDAPPAAYSNGHDSHAAPGA